ncbi:MAG: EboA domain-containing protein [Myxococcota bacterium]
MAPSALEHVLSSLPAATSSWQESITRRTGLAFDGGGGALRTDAFLIAFSGVTRELDASEQATPWCSWRTAWPLSELARAAMLLAAAQQLPADKYVTLLSDLYRYAESGEKCALLRTLPLIDEPRRFLNQATDASRGSIPTVFEALACENPYPAAHFPDGTFNQLVLKVVTMGLPLARVHNLPERVNAELVQMARTYAEERRGAGRSVPADLGLLTGPIRA